MGSTVGVVGAGYVGLTTAACLAHLDHRVRCVDIDAARVAGLCRGQVHIAEPDLAGLVARGLTIGRLSFSADPATLAGLGMGACRAWRRRWAMAASRT